jgi:hypothetical protein
MAVVFQPSIVQTPHGTIADSSKSTNSSKPGGSLQITHFLWFAAVWKGQR